MPCAFCDREYALKRRTGKYCSTKCRCAAWTARREAWDDRLRGVFKVLTKEAGLTAEDLL